MLKILAAAFAGVFIGAMTVEILNKTKPGWIEKTRAKIKDTMKVAKEAFMEGDATGQA